MIKVLSQGELQTNTLVVGSGEVFLPGSDVFIVDPAGSSLSMDESVLTDFLEDKKLNPIAVVLTHGHFDHVLGLPYLKNKFPKIPILIHKDDSIYLGKNSFETHKLMLDDFGAHEFDSYLTSLPEPDFLLEDSKSLGDYINHPLLNDYLIIHTPGHTKGSCCFYSKKENTLISGDTLFFNSYGRTDMPGGSEEQMIKSLELLNKKIPKDTIVFPRHGFGFRKTR